MPYQAASAPKPAISRWWKTWMPALRARATGGVSTVQGEMRALAHADRGADQGEPGEHHLAHFLDPEEVDRIDVEPIGDRDHDVAQEHADQQVDDRQHDQRRDGDARQPLDESSWGSDEASAARFGPPEAPREPREDATRQALAPQALKPAISSHSSPILLLVGRPDLLLRQLAEGLDVGLDHRHALGLEQLLGLGEVVDRLGELRGSCSALRGRRRASASLRVGEAVPDVEVHDARSVGP